MKYNNEECLTRMLRIIGEDRVIKYQNASATYDVYGPNPLEKIYIDNPLKMDILHYILAVNDCIATLFNQIDFNEMSNIVLNKQLIEDIKYFQQVYCEDIIQSKK